MRRSSGILAAGNIIVDLLSKQRDTSPMVRLQPWTGRRKLSWLDPGIYARKLGGGAYVDCIRILLPTMNDKLKSCRSLQVVL